MTAGGEAYQAALVFYQSVKMAAAQDIPGAKAVYEELKTRFPGGKRRSSEPETGKKVSQRAEFGTKRPDFASPRADAGSLREELDSQRPDFDSWRADIETLRADADSPKMEGRSRGIGGGFLRVKGKILGDENGSLRPKDAYWQE